VEFWWTGKKLETVTPFQSKLLQALLDGPKRETQLVQILFPKRKLGPSFHKAHVMNGLMRLMKRGLVQITERKHYHNPTTGGYSDDTWELRRHVP